MNADVEKAVESLGTRFISTSDGASEVRVVVKALRDQEAEIANLKRCVSHECIVAEDHIRIAKESADLLRDVSRYLDPAQFPEAIARITAHLGANHD